MKHTYGRPLFPDRAEPMEELPFPYDVLAKMGGNWCDTCETVQSSAIADTDAENGWQYVGNRVKGICMGCLLKKINNKNQ